MSLWAVSTKSRETSPRPKPVSGWRSKTRKREATRWRGWRLLLRGKLPDADREAIGSSYARRRGPGRRVSGQRSVRAGPASGTARGVIRQGGRLRARGQRRSHWLSLEKRKLVHDPAEHERFVSGLIEAFEPALFRRLAGAGLEYTPAGFHRRLAPIGDHADRADPGQPFPVPRRRRAAPGPARLSGDPRAARPR